MMIENGNVETEPAKHADAHAEATAVPQVDLETYRIEKGLTYRELADLIGASTPARARAWALGFDRPNDAQELVIERVTGGRVGVFAMREKRLQHRRDAEGRAARDLGSGRSRDEAA